MVLEGNMRDFPLSDLLTMVSDSAVTGMIEIGEQGYAGRIFCRNGRVYHIESAQQNCYDAIRQLIELHEAPFRFIAGVHYADDTLWPDQIALIGFTRRQEELYRRVRKYIPRLDWIPVLCIFSSGARIRLSAAIWPILAGIDGQRSVAEIAALVGQEPFEIGLAIGDLIARGLANIKPPHAVTPAAPPASPRADEQNSGGFFERLLMGKTRDTILQFTTKAQSVEDASASPCL
jgi:hypothetical protein